MKNKIVIGIFAVFILAVTSLVAVFAYQGNPNVEGPNYNEDVHLQIERAINAGDYDAWIKIREENNLPMKGRMFQVINEDNFDKYRELHNAMQAGDIETANAIKAELGLGMGSQNHKGTQNVGTSSYSNAGCGNCPMHG